MSGWAGICCACAWDSLFSRGAGPGGLFRGAAGHPAQPTIQELALSLAGRRLPAAIASDIYAVQGTTGADAGFRFLLEAMASRGQLF